MLPSEVLKLNYVTLGNDSFVIAANKDQLNSRRLLYIFSNNGTGWNMIHNHNTITIVIFLFSNVNNRQGKFST